MLAESSGERPHYHAIELVSRRRRGGTPSSRRRVDGVEVDTTIQHERAVKYFDLCTAMDRSTEKILRVVVTVVHTKGSNVEIV